jgi:hypothetical protein
MLECTEICEEPTRRLCAQRRIVCPIVHMQRINVSAVQRNGRLCMYHKNHVYHSHHNFEKKRKKKCKRSTGQMKDEC